MNPLTDTFISPLASWYTGLRMEGAGAPATTTPPPADGGAAGGDDAAAAAAKAAADKATADAAAAAAGTPAAPTPGSADDPATWDKDRAAATIANQRRQEAELKRQLAEETRKREEAERANMGEEERKEAERKATAEENERLRAQARSSTLFATLAGRTDVADAEIARDLLIQRGLQFDEQGQPVGLDEAVNNLLEAKPVLRKGEGAAPPPANANGNGGGSAPPNANGAAGSGGQGPSPQLTEDEVTAANEAGMSPEKFASMKQGMSLSDWEAQRKKESEGGDSGN